MKSFRDNIVEQVHTALPALKMCRAHGGRFDLGELKAVAARCPAAFVAPLRVVSTQDDGDGRTVARIRWALYIVTRDAPQLPRDVAALHLVEWLLVWLPRQRWGGPSGRPEGVSADNLFSRQVDGVGVALWGLTWEQTHRFGESAFEQLPEFLPTHLYSAFEPDTGPPRDDNYCQLAPEEG